MDLAIEAEEDFSNGLLSSPVEERQRLLDESEGLNDARERQSRRANRTTYEDALLSCGWGWFHLKTLLLCGWAVSSDAIEVLSVSFLLPSATCDLSLTSSDKGWLNSIVFVGMLVGGYVWGSLADRWGRRNILIWSLLLNGVGNLCSSASQVFWLFLVCRFFSGVGVGGSMPVVFTYYTELQHKSRRGAMISVLATFWMAGNIVAAGLAWLIIPQEQFSFETTDFTFHSWRVYVLFCTIPSISSALLFVLMPESPKFLLMKGREQDAIQVLKHIHARNKSYKKLKLESLVLTEDDPENRNEGFKIIQSHSKSAFQSFKSIVKDLAEGTAKLFRKPLKRTTLLLLIVNFTLAFGYYGLFLWFPELFNRVDKYGGTFCDIKTGNDTDTDQTCDPPGNNVYINGFLTSVSNLPGNILTILLVERLGRKALLSGSMVLSGVSVFLLWFVKTNWQNVMMSCIFGAISVCGFNMLDVLQTELFPTEVRSTAFGVQTAAVRVGAILGNVIFGELVDVYCAVPMLLVAGLLAFGGLASLGLPNTTGIDIH